MIRIDRSAIVPVVLEKKGIAARREMEAAYDVDPIAYANGVKRFEADSGIYGDTSVKEALKTMQREKCAFCESDLLHVAHGDVEHFRPKAGVREGTMLARPGYFWLAYEWTNLLFSCEICNRSFKKSDFPLADPSKRARSHHDDIDNEEPLLIDPSRMNPEEHIVFKSWKAFSRQRSTKGRETITVLGLNRERLKLRRERHYKNLLFFIEVSEDTGAATNIRERARQFLEEAIADTAEYTAMARALLAARPLPI